MSTPMAKRKNCAAALERIFLFLGDGEEMATHDRMRGSWLGRMKLVCVKGAEELREFMEMVQSGPLGFVFVVVTYEY